MSDIVAYFIGGKFDLTKRVIDNYAEVISFHSAPNIFYALACTTDKGVLVYELIDDKN